MTHYKNNDAAILTEGQDNTEVDFVLPHGAVYSNFAGD